MDLILKEFQEDAKEELLTALAKGKKDITMQAPTGSGKTIILCKMVEDYFATVSKKAVVWLTPGNGELEEQSLEKFQRFLEQPCKTLNDALRAGINEEDIIFINWEQLNKVGNKALRDQETKNLKDRIDEAINNGLSFTIIVDEAHRNATNKSDNILDLFGKSQLIQVSATFDKKVHVDIDIDERDVIESGLITRYLCVNDGITGVSSMTIKEYETLLKLAIEKQKLIESEYRKHGLEIRPLILVQYPDEKKNKADEAEVARLIDEVDEFLDKNYGYNYDNKHVARWLSGDKRNIDAEENQPEDSVIILHTKQAIATGWDCPRAKILVTLRHTENVAFEIQVLGRIRRMPEQKHYGNNIMDNCYLYTLDTAYKNKAYKLFQGRLPKTLYIKDEYKDVSLGLTKETRQESLTDSGKREVAEAIREEFINQLKLQKTYGDRANRERIAENNKEILKAHGFVFEDSVSQQVVTGVAQTIGELAKKDSLSSISLQRDETRESERSTYSDVVRSMSGHLSSLKLQRSAIEHQILERLFRKPRKTHKRDGQVLQLNERDFHHFIINNRKIIPGFIRKAQYNGIQKKLRTRVSVHEEPFAIPSKDLVYLIPDMIGAVIPNNIYDDYTTNIEGRSNCEKLFEKHCVKCGDVKWYYKNGDKGPAYFSIVYTDNFGIQSLFYPDYILETTDGTLYIVEAKGGEDVHGNSKNIDKDTAEIKFKALKAYVEKHNAKGGRQIKFAFVRDEEMSDGWGGMEIVLKYNDTEWTEEMGSNWKKIDKLF